MRFVKSARCFLAVVLALATSCLGSVEDRREGIYALKAEPNPENVARIRMRLDDRDAAVRAASLYALVDLGVADACDLAIRGLSDPDGFVRRTAAHQLVKLADPAAVPALGERVMEDEDAGVRKEAAAALGAIGSADAVDHLVFALEDPMSEVRLEATKGLARGAPEAAVDALVSMVLQDPEWEIRVQAAMALARSGREDVVPILREAANDPNELVRAAVIEALERKGATQAPAPPEDES